MCGGRRVEAVRLEELEPRVPEGLGAGQTSIPEPKPTLGLALTCKPNT